MDRVAKPAATPREDGLMDISLTNSATRKKERFTPLDPDNVKGCLEMLRLLLPNSWS